jgi:predicted Zn-dependent protease
MDIEKKYILSLEKAKKQLQMADHLTYMTFPLVKENRLLLKILDELSGSVTNMINAILQYEYTYKRIQLYNDARENFRTFKAISQKYNINQEQMNKIIDLLSLNEKHKKSPFEFVKNNKIVIMSDSLKTDTITIDKIKEFLIEAKDLLRKANATIREI